MSFYDLVNNIENLSEATSMSNIVYLPAQIGKVKKAISSLAKLKKELNIEILESDGNKEVKFGDALSITVPNKHWSSFLEMFNKKDFENAYLDLKPLLLEAMEDKIQDLKLELKPTLIRAFTNPPFDNLEEDVNRWRIWFGARVFKDQDVVISYNNKRRGLLELYKNLCKAYNDDTGGLEMLIDNIENKEPLSAFEMFKAHDFLYGAKVSSHFLEVGLVFEATVDMSFVITESIFVSEVEVVDEVEADVNSVKVVKNNLLYPRGERFDSNFFRILKDKVEDKEKYLRI